MFVVLADPTSFSFCLIFLSASASPRLLQNGATALTLAALYGNVAVVELLLQRGARIEATDDKGEGPRFSQFSSALRTRSAVADGGAGALSYAASRDTRLPSLLALLAAGANIEAMDSGGRSPLSWAAGNGAAVCVRALLERGASTQSKDKARGWRMRCTTMPFMYVKAAAR